MRLRRRAASFITVAALGCVLTGCSAVDLIIWGPDGSRVIAATAQVIEAASAGDADSLSCDDSVAEYGEPQDWVGANPGEPEPISELWAEQADLGATWSINIESGVGRQLTTGDVIPGDVFYRETDGGLCVVDVTWGTVGIVSG